MRNLLGRLHARRLPELLRIADAWNVPLAGVSKDEVAGSLYRAMADPRAMRDVWDQRDAAERAVLIALADAAVANAAPTVAELAAALQTAEPETREIALRLYRMGILAREGDDEPLPVGDVPRLILPREMVLNVRRIQDEIAAADLERAPLRVLIELLDDAELEGATRAWGLRPVPGVFRRRDLATKLLRLVADPRRGERVVQGRSRDAAAIWKIVRAAPKPLPLPEVIATAGLAATDKETSSRRRAALAELEGALLVWHTYHADGSRWLFIPEEIRSPAKPAPVAAPALTSITVDVTTGRRWRHPDAVAWDLLTLLRIVSDPNAPTWDVAESPPRWLARIAGPRLWWGSHEGLPTGYLELLQAVGVAAGVLAIDEDARPRRIVAGAPGRAWRAQSFPAQTARLREQWLRLARWVEGEPADLVEIWGADWRGMRPRLLAALADPDVGLRGDGWVTLESLAARLAMTSPTLLGASYIAATARLEAEGDGASDEDEARAKALSDVIALELAGPFAWFALTEIVDVPGQPRAVRLTPGGAALAAQQPLPADKEAGDRKPAMTVDVSGEITLRAPTPSRVWALSAFTEPVDLGPESHYRLTESSLGAALAAGVEPEQVTSYLERASRQPLPEVLAGRLAAWAVAVKRVRVEHAFLLRVDDDEESAALGRALRDEGWQAAELADRTLLVTPPEEANARSADDQLWLMLRAAGYAPLLAKPAAEIPLTASGTTAPSSTRRARRGT